MIRWVRTAVSVWAIASILAHVAIPAINGEHVDPAWAWAAAVWILVFGIIATRVMWEGDL